MPVLAKKTRSRPVRFGQAQREFGLSFVVEEVRGVNERAALFGDGLFDCGMAVAKRVDADAAQQVEIAVAVFVDEVNALAAHKENRIALIGL